MADLSELARQKAAALERIRSSYRGGLPIKRSDLEFLNADVEAILGEILDPRWRPVIHEDRFPRKG